MSESATPAERREDTLQTNTLDESSNEQHYLKSLDNHFKERDKEEDINSEWRDVSNVLDRLFLILYVVVTLVVSLTIILRLMYQ